MFRLDLYMMPGYFFSAWDLDNSYSLPSHVRVFMLMRIIEYSSRWHHETFSSATVYENICYLLIVYAW